MLPLRSIFMLWSVFYVGRTANILITLFWLRAMVSVMTLTLQVLAINVDLTANIYVYGHYLCWPYGQHNDHTILSKSYAIKIESTF